MLSDTMMLGGGRKAATSIENSLLFRGGQYLSRKVPQQADGSRFTVSAWFRWVGEDVLLLGGDAVSNPSQIWVRGDSAALQIDWKGYSLVTRRKFRDPSGWYHLVASFDTGNPIAADRCTVWVNGEKVTDFDADQRVNWSGSGHLNAPGQVNYIGHDKCRGYGQQYIAEFVLVDGGVHAPSSFGEVDPLTGSWRPKLPQVAAWGPSGCYLTFSGLTTIGGTRGAAQKFGGTMNGVAKGSYTNGGGYYNIGTLNSAGYKTSGRWYMGYASSSRWLWWARQDDTVNPYQGYSTASVLLKHTPQRFHHIKVGGNEFEQIDDTASDWPTDSSTFYWSVLDLDIGQVEFYDTAGRYLFERAVSGWSPGSAYSTATCSFDGIAVYFNLQDEAPGQLKGPGTGATIIVDGSGGGNSWTVSGIVPSDFVVDTPTNVFTTLSPLDKSTASGISMRNGALSVRMETGGPSAMVASGRYVSSGKWYWEIPIADGQPRSSFNVSHGVVAAAAARNGWVGQDSFGWGWRSDQKKAHGGSVVSYGVKYGDTLDGGGNLMVALDLVAGAIWFGKDGVWQGGATLEEIESGDTQHAAFTGVVGPVCPAASTINMHCNMTYNFGQNPFAFTRPAGFKPLSTADLPATSGQPSGTFTGNASADGPCIYTGAVPQTLSINGNAVTWGVHADKLATGFKIRTASTAYNSTGSNTWTAAYDRKPTVGPKGRAPANAQVN